MTEDCYNDRSSCREGNLEQEVIGDNTIFVDYQTTFLQVAYFLDRSLEMWKFLGAWSSLPAQFEQMSFKGEL